MYCIAVYDVGEKRVNKMLKLFRQYLNWIQNSVFEGYISEKNLKILTEKALDIMDNENDSVIFFTMSSDKYINKQILGKDLSHLTSNII